jgi:hypothetical protein
LLSIEFKGYIEFNQTKNSMAPIIIGVTLSLAKGDYGTGLRQAQPDALFLQTQPTTWTSSALQLLSIEFKGYNEFDQLYGSNDYRMSP